MPDRKRIGTIALIHIPYVILVLLSLFFYQERLYADSGYYLIRVINSGFFHIEHQRLVLAIPQLVPLLEMLSGCHLKAILIGYSIGHVLFFYILTLIVLFRLKDIPAAVALVLIQFVGIAQSFFAPQFEMYYGAGFLIMFWSILNKTELNGKNLALLCLLEILVLSSHPMSFLLMLYLLLLFNQEKGKVHRKQLALFLGIMVAALAIKLFTFSEYEQSKIGFHLNFNLNKQYMNLLTGSYWVDLVRYLAMQYPDLLILFIMNSMYYIAGRNRVRLVLTTVFFLGYILFINTMYMAIETGRYIEQIYFPAAVILILPFTNDFYRNFPIKPISTTLIVLLVGFRILLIIQAGIPFQQRIVQIRRITSQCQQFSGNRFTFDLRNIQRDYTNTGWSYPIESLLISAQEKGQKAVTLISAKDLENTLGTQELSPDEYIFRNHEILPVQELNPHYFSIDTGYYISLNTKGDLPTDHLQISKGIGLEALVGKSYQPGELVYIPVSIVNLNPFPLYSALENKLFLSYHIFREDNTLIAWEGLRTPLETDLYTIGAQDIMIKLPAEAGVYRLVIDMILEGKGWFNLNESHLIRIR